MATIPIPQPTGNPLLDNPQLKAALTAQMGQQQAPAQPQGAIMPPGGAVPPPTIQPGPHNELEGGLAPLPKMTTPAPEPPAASVGAQKRLSDLQSQGSGVSQIAHKIEGTQFGQNHPTLGKILGLGAQIPLQVLDSIAGAASPILRSVETGIPGTEEHHHMLVNQQQRQLGQDVANEEKQATTAHTQAETAGLPAAEEEKTRLEDAQIQNLLHPQAKTEFEDWRQRNPNDPTENFFKAQQAAKPGPEGERPLGNTDNLNAALQDRFQVLNPGKPLPSQYKLPANATQKDYERVDKALAGVESAQGTKEQRAQTAAMREQAMAIASQNRGEKQETSTRQAAYKAFTPALDSAERFNVMSGNYEDAIKNHDQQAMLSLLANHLGMTMGLQKGARITRDLYKEAENSRPWLQGAETHFDKDGYLTGVTLAPVQMQQMMNLARNRYSEDTKKARSEAQYMGATDDGPRRTPNQSTVNSYLGLANGDKTKAKQLMADDGWTIQ